ncbi:TonB-dependent receptor [Croceivirga thetidis]|uniref:Plug domain-containing protein n=1 Tax=Croceivirga thetidis TaxID=2721623 RepID=A0ABX1GPY6_9FLAO|nr:TonB-dependent receptor plug domain-containing protein [Croceivirga thetidis]NKI31970.1 Plug domain-containing protein [Croceivirga thetidis]
MKSSKFLYTFAFALLLVLTVNAQQSGPNSTHSLNSRLISEDFFQTTERDSLSLWREQVLLHTDAEIYKPQQNLFFKAYVLTGPNELRVSASDVLRVELLDQNGNLVSNQYHKIQSGSANGAIEIPKKLEDGTYYLRAYTRWMLNYGEENLPSKALKITNESNEFTFADGDMTIAPEGGVIVVGLENKVILSNLSGNTIVGQIVDENGKVISSITNYEDGLATFNFTPQTGKSYYFKPGSGEQLSPIEAQDEGILLQANAIETNSLKVRVQATDAMMANSYKVKGTKNGLTYFETPITFENGKRSFELEIPKKGLPQGIMNLEVSDEYNQIWTKRPVYIQSGDLNITVDKEAIVEDSNNKRLRYRVKVSDAEGNPVTTELSLSVREEESINSSVSDMKRNSNFLTDLKVLAGRDLHGELPKKNIETPDNIKYSFQNGLEFYGQAYDFNNTLLKNKDIQVFVNNENEVEVKEVATNDDGLFSLTGLQLDGEVTLTFRREGKNTMEKLVKVIPYEYEVPELNLGKELTTSTPKIQKSKQFIPKKRLVDFDFADKPANLIPLEEVTLVGKKRLSKVTKSVYNITPSRVAYQSEERPKTIPQLFLGIPGVYVTNLGDIERVSVSLPQSYGLGPVLWVLDGIPLVQPDQASIDNATTPLAEIMSLVSFIDVERIELLRGADAGVFGSRAGGGVILIYTKSGAYSSEYIARKDAQTTFEGYEIPIAFDDYLEVISRKRKLKENNKTLFWNPSLVTNENGEATFEFEVLHEDSSLMIDVKAVTEEGKRASYTTSLQE